MSRKNVEIDEVDRKIVGILNHDAEVTNATLGERVGLSSSAANERVRKLKNQGVIKRIVALADSKFMNMGLCAFIYALIDKQENDKNFIKAVTKKSVYFRMSSSYGGVLLYSKG